MKKVLVLAAAALLLVAASSGATLFLTGYFSRTEPTPPAQEPGESKAEEPSGPPRYVRLDPAFTVSFGEEDAEARFLQLTLDVVTYDPQVEESPNTHMPAVRNSLVLLFSSQKASDLASREGKEELRRKSLEEIQRVLTKQTGSAGVRDVFFTSFVIQ